MNRTDELDKYHLKLRAKLVQEYWDEIAELKYYLKDNHNQLYEKCIDLATSIDVRKLCSMIYYDAEYMDEMFRNQDIINAVLEIKKIHQYIKDNQELVEFWIL